MKCCSLGSVIDLFFRCFPAQAETQGTVRSGRIYLHCFQNRGNFLFATGAGTSGGNINPERAALLAIFHDVPEVITGDMPTPVKYFSSEIRRAYAGVESAAENRLLSLLPEDMRDEYIPLITHEGEDAQLLKIVKCADKLSALIKCIEEEKAYNKEFSAAKAATIQSIREMGLPEGIEFLEKFIPPFELTLDDQNM